MKRLLCFGDSNTYGFDPRSYIGERFPPNIRWTGLLGGDFEIIEAGQNGRMIPRRREEIAGAVSLIRRSAPLDVFVVMLGTNDLLNGAAAEEAALRMRRFLEAVLPGLGDARLLLIAPPPLRPGAWVPGTELIGESERFALALRELAENTGVSFADAGGWDVEAAFDGVHFAEAGHRAFAEGLRAALPL